MRCNRRTLAPTTYSLFKIQIHGSTRMVQNEQFLKILLTCRIPAFAQMLSFLDSPMNWANSSGFA